MKGTHHQISIAYEGIDTDTPKNAKLCAKYMRSFAYYTVKDRLPVILTKVIDELVIHKDKIISELGVVAVEDLKSVIGGVSKLKNELVTNKSFVKLFSKQGDDVESWNNYLECQLQEGDMPCWFYSPWLYVECYMYRRLWEIFENSKGLQEYDPFVKQKEDAFYVLLPEIKFVAEIMLGFLSQLKFMEPKLNERFKEFIKLSLWSNRCDLSLSNRAHITKENCDLSNINELDSLLLIDDSEKVYKFLSHHKNAVIDLISDNSGYEVFCDFCLCDVLCTSSLASKITFHVKKIAWYVSDVMKKDVNWLLEKLAEEGMEELSCRWKKYFQDGIWSVSEESYWTLPFDYSDMKARDGILYDSLRSSNLVIFKGDLNYRKLLGDINWDHCEKFEVALREFKPTNILSLRTVKADLICGLSSEICERFAGGDKMWMRSGDFGTIQFSQSIDFPI